MQAVLAANVPTSSSPRPPVRQISRVNVQSATDRVRGVSECHVAAALSCLRLIKQRRTWCHLVRLTPVVGAGIVLPIAGRQGHAT